MSLSLPTSMTSGDYPISIGPRHSIAVPDSDLIENTPSYYLTANRLIQSTPLWADLFSTPRLISNVIFLSSTDPKASLVSAIRSDKSLIDPQQPSYVEPAAIDAAVRFIVMLPTGLKLPKYAPDAEGALLLVWQDSLPSIVTIEGDRLHFSEKAQNGDEYYLDDIVLNDSNILGEIMIRLQLRYRSASGV